MWFFYHYFTEHSRGCVFLTQLVRVDVFMNKAPRPPHLGAWGPCCPRRCWLMRTPFFFKKNNQTLLTSMAGERYSSTYILALISHKLITIHEETDTYSLHNWTVQTGLCQTGNHYGYQIQTHYTVFPPCITRIAFFIRIEYYVCLSIVLLILRTSFLSGSGNTSLLKGDYYGIILPPRLPPPPSLLQCALETADSC